MSKINPLFPNSKSEGLKSAIEQTMLMDDEEQTYKKK